MTDGERQAVVGRRRFLTELAMAGAAAAAAATPGSAAALPSGNHAARTAEPFGLEDLTIADLQKKMQSGEETARSLVEKYLARIDALDRNGPILRQVLETNPDALSIAEGLDKERESKGPRGPLHGIPVRPFGSRNRP